MIRRRRQFFLATVYGVREGWMDLGEVELTQRDRAYLLMRRIEQAGRTDCWQYAAARQFILDTWETHNGS